MPEESTPTTTTAAVIRVAGLFKDRHRLLSRSIRKGSRVSPRRCGLRRYSRASNLGNSTDSRASNRSRPSRRGHGVAQPSNRQLPNRRRIRDSHWFHITDSSRGSIRKAAIRPLRRRHNPRGRRGAGGHRRVSVTSRTMTTTAAPKGRRMPAPARFHRLRDRFHRLHPAARVDLCRRWASTGARRRCHHRACRDTAEPLRSHRRATNPVDRRSTWDAR